MSEVYYEKNLTCVFLGIIIFILSACSGNEDIVSDNLKGAIGEEMLYNSYFWNEKEILLEADADTMLQKKKRKPKLMQK